ncbi:MAG: sigma-70 family RNA polymerase sigma factor [Deltaproteobacteria bacterium]|nr:sigma-70 family RNA polymerase sigma factor [Deltaproteobacteria bacterium]
MVVRLQGGDPAAFDTLVARYGDKIYRLATGITRNSADAEDVCQEVFLSGLRNIKTFEGRAALGTWIYRIATNAALMRLRGRPTVSLTPWEEELPRFQPDGGHQVRVSDWSANPEETLMEKETRSVLQEALASLPPEYRTVVLLRDVEGLSASAAAETLGLSVAAIKSRLHRGRLFLRARVSEYFQPGLPPTSGSLR